MFVVAIVSVPPACIASRALTARLSSTCSSWPRSARTRASDAATRSELDVLADDPPQHRCDPAHDVAQVEHRRLKDLLSAERQQLMSERCGAVRRVDDLVEVFGRLAVLVVRMRASCV